MRMTTQRIKILEFLQGVKTHPTAEDVYKEVKKDLPALTLATVYRNLNQMAENGDILRLEINKEYHYDADTSSHQHCVCKSCWKVFDLFQKELSEFALQRLNFRGFTPCSVNIIFYGKCGECRKNKEAMKND